MTTYYLAIDPGKDKCGLAVIDEKKNHYVLQNTPLSELESNLQKINTTYTIKALIIGDGTGSNQIKQLVTTTLPDKKINIIDETNTTYLAKQLYWQYNKPKGWQRLLPQGLRTAPQALDSYAALAIAIRWLEKSFQKNHEKA